MVKEILFKLNKNMKNLFICFIIVLSEAICSAQTNLSLEIVGVKKEGGKIHVSLFNSEQSFEERSVYLTLVSNPDSVNINLPLNLPAGEYLFSIYQDNNNNGELDTNFPGIPRELFGFSNYDGKSIPGSFKKHKVLVKETTKKISVHLLKI